MKKPKLKLSKIEEDFICWQESYYKNNIRSDNKRAVRYAWRMATRKFPRLEVFKFKHPQKVGLN